MYLVLALFWVVAILFHVGGVNRLQPITVVNKTQALRNCEFTDAANAFEFRTSK